jgi:hypothetical protein
VGEELTDARLPARPRLRREHGCDPAARHGEPPTPVAEPGQAAILSPCAAELRPRLAVRAGPRAMIRRAVHADHHSAYLAKALSALTPEGRRRAQQLLGELVEVAGGHAWVASFARERSAEVDSGRLQPRDGPDPTLELSDGELDRLTSGFMAIRDEEQLDDVTDWANSVIALITDERDRGFLG